MSSDVLWACTGSVNDVFCLPSGSDGVFFHGFELEGGFCPDSLYLVDHSKAIWRQICPQNKSRFHFLHNLSANYK